MNKKSMDSLKIKLSGVLPELNERQRRILLAAEAKSLGYGGVKALSNISGVAVSTIRRGILDLGVKPKHLIASRTAGGGRKKSTDSNPDLKKILQEIIAHSGQSGHLFRPQSGHLIRSMAATRSERSDASRRLYRIFFQQSPGFSAPFELISGRRLGPVTSIR